MDTMNSESSGGKTTLYIVVFFLCVISAMSGYFYFTINSAEAEAQKKIEKIQASAKQELATAKSEAEKREIAQKAAFETAKARVEATAKAKESALKSREARLKASEAAVGKRLRDASASVARAKKYEREAAATRRKAQNLANQANAAMKRAKASGKAADIKLANEKKRLLKEYQKQVAAANKRVTVARNQAKAEARKALALNNRLRQAEGKLRGKVWEYAARYGGVPGYPKKGTSGYQNRFNVSDPNVCKSWARGMGYEMWGHRGPSHPNKKYRNSCWAYQKAPRYTGDSNDGIHVVGCSFGGRPNYKNGCANYLYRGRRTRANDWGGGKSIYLDRHDVDCGNDGLNNFRLYRPRSNQIAYTYGCLEGINAGRTNKNTGTNDWGGGNTIFLDRHNVNCGNNPIARFRLVRPAGNKIRYDYSCSKANSTGKCTNKNTGWNQESWQNIYLDRHNVKCGTNEALTRFQLRRTGKGKFRYDYRCCKMP